MCNCVIVGGNNKSCTHTVSDNKKKELNSIMFIVDLNSLS